ncbi:MAG: hypothetical protein M3Y12_15265 [Bacteroidota bacterium]|nr:hypothetical protein [Bacteroidota bacterium]
MKLLLLLGLGWSVAARAQGTGGTYSAPGMPLHLQNRTHTIPIVTKTSLSPVAVLPRFWHSASAIYMNVGYAQSLYFIQYNTVYPQIALDIEFEARVYIRAVIPAAGEPSAIEVVKRNKVVGAQKAASNALEAESIRVVRAMRFEHKTGVSDTIVFPMLYTVP